MSIEKGGKYFAGYYFLRNSKRVRHSVTEEQISRAHSRRQGNHRLCHTSPALQQFSNLPGILTFMVPEVIYLTVLCLYPETKVIGLPPGFEDVANLDLTVVQEKQDGRFVCLVV